MVQILEQMGVTSAGSTSWTREIRQGIKAFSHWPTIPQLYVKGEFLGGWDIVREMFATGELKRS